MADFSAQSADLSAPSGAGSQPVAAPKMNLPSSGLPQALTTLGSMLTQGVSDFSQAALFKQKNAILGQVAQDQDAINQAVASGQMNAQEAHVRQSAIYSKSLAAYPSMAGDFDKLNTAFKATTQVGDTDTAIKNAADEAQKVRDDENGKLIAAGYLLNSSTTEAQRQLMVGALQANVTAQRMQQQQWAQEQHARESNTYDQGQQDRQNKEQSISLLNNVAGAQLDSVGAELQSMRAAVSAGTLPIEAAQAQWAARMAGINGVMVAAAGKTPELVNSFKGLFDGYNQLAQKAFDPKTKAEDLDAEFKTMVTRTKIGIVAGDAKTRTLVAASELFGGNNSMLLATNAQQITKVLMGASTTPTNNGTPSGYVPQIVGNPEVEQGSLDAIKSGVKMLQQGNIKNKDAAGIEASNSVNNILLQTGKALDNGATPQSLKGLATFFSSPEYGYMVKNGQIDQQANMAAKKTFQMIYEPSMVNAIGDKLTAKMPGSDFPVQNNIDVQFTGAGAIFVAKKGLTGDALTSANSTIAGLKAAQTGLNTLVKIGAHMEGTTDYQTYWDNNKYKYLPQIYPDPAKLKPGQVEGGRKYIGGNYRNPDNWVAVGASNGN